ncbi:MAG TPA: M48 family metalloprotease [Vicinamibacterales bacterium]|jgi:Zn-dependent protease with chaperone function|nr:M48 family metalloprotease [Vicinamibacterales bacterium]
MNRPRRTVAVAATAVLAAWVTLTAQTKITAPPNKYSPEDDVKLGLQAAEQVRQQMPVMHDDAINGYLEDVGGRLVRAIPPEFQHPEFHYTFTALNLKEINAFALPGGPMFVNRGMMDKARTEGEIAGVMAHELSHVALRHGTAQQSKATPYQVGSIAGAIVGAIVGGGLGQVISQGTQFGLGAAFLRFSREFEKQADLLGTHIMARAGYDPRDMANVFKTIEQESGPGGPQWLSDHPNPGNRYEYIMKEAASLHVTNPTEDTRAFDQIQAHIATLGPAMSSEEAARNANRGTGSAPDARPSGRVERPSSRYRTYQEGGVFRVQVPDNWQELPGNNVVTFAPQGAYGSLNGSSVFTHGVEIGVARNETHDLQTATSELIDSLRQGNPRLSRPSEFARTTVAGQQGLATQLSNISDATGGEERIAVYTTLLRDGTLFYVIGVAPNDEFAAYDNAFSRIVRSIQIAR